MKGLKKVYPSLMVLPMLFTTVIGCSDTTSTKPADSTAAKDEIVELTYLTTGDQAAKPIQGDDRIVAEINKRFGIKLNVKIVPQGAFDKINVAFASGDLPDVVTTQYPSDAVSQWIKEGLIVPINDYLKEMPTIKGRLDKSLSWTAVEGKYYGYPFITQLERSNNTIQFRADWLEKLGLQPPKTLDEFYNTLKAIVTKDPDGNGKDDTYGYTTVKTSGSGTINGFNWVFYAYGLPYSDWVLDDKGNIAPKFEHPSFKKGMEYLKKLMDEKLIEPEFMLNDTQMKEQKFYKSKVGFMDGALFRHVNRIETSLQKVEPKGKLGFIDPPAGPDGKRGMNQASKGGLFTAVTKMAKNPEKAAKFIEFMISPEGREFLQLGIEGIHYTKKDGKIVYNEPEREKDNFAPGGWSHPLAWGNVTYPLDQNYLPESEPGKERAIESVEIASRNIVPSLVKYTTKAEIEYNGVVNELYNQYFMNMLNGKIGIDKGIAELGQKWRAQGGDKILKEVTDAYKSSKK
jgi:putative aldouronate transport system substrate-binding protein